MHMYCMYVQSGLTHLHTSILSLDEIGDKMRELDECGSSSTVYSRIIVDLIQQKLLGKVRELDIRGADK